jgi:hypothetical protein
MMDGRIQAIRTTLDANGFGELGVGIPYFAPVSVILLLTYLTKLRMDEPDFLRMLGAAAVSCGRLQLAREFTLTNHSSYMISIVKACCESYMAEMRPTTHVRTDHGLVKESTGSSNERASQVELKSLVWAIVGIALVAGLGVSSIHKDGFSIFRGIIGAFGFFWAGLICACAGKSYEGRIAAAAIGILLLVVVVLIASGR